MSSGPCGAGTLACSAETHLGVDAFPPASRPAFLPPRSGPLDCHSIPSRILNRSTCAEMSLGAAGKSACATKTNKRGVVQRLAVFLLLAMCAVAQDPRQIIEEVQRRSRSNSQRYEGTLEVSGGDKRVSTKRWVFERIGSFGDSKSVLRFVVPPEVKGVGLLIVNHPDRASDQWMWRPSIGRDQRIALQDRSTRFFGTDFSFEDLEERDVDQYDYKLLADDGSAWKIE